MVFTWTDDAQPLFDFASTISLLYVHILYIMANGRRFVIFFGIPLNWNYVCLQYLWVKNIVNESRENEREVALEVCILYRIEFMT